MIYWKIAILSNNTNNSNAQAGFCADSPATNTIGRLSGWSSICLAIQGPSKWAYHQPFFLFWGSLYWSAGRMKGMRKYRCWRFMATSWCWAVIAGAGFCSAAVWSSENEVCVQSGEYSKHHSVFNKCNLLILMVLYVTAENTMSEAENKSIKLSKHTRSKRTSEIWHGKAG